MNTYSFYDQHSGLFHPMRITCSNPVDLITNTPAGHVAIVGRFDRTHRMDLKTGQVEPHESPPDLVSLAAQARARRGRMLAESDWTQAVDVALSGPQIAAWRAYRTALRAIPQQKGFPLSVEWPVEP